MQLLSACWRQIAQANDVALLVEEVLVELEDLAYHEYFVAAHVIPCQNALFKLHQIEENHLTLVEAHDQVPVLEEQLSYFRICLEL